MNSLDLWNGQFSFKKQPTPHPVYVGKTLEINKSFVEFAFGVLLVLKKKKQLNLGSLGMELPFLAQDNILGFVIAALLWEGRGAACSFHVPHFLLCDLLKHMGQTCWGP